MKILPKSINFAKEGSNFYKTLKKPTKVCQKSHLAKFGEVSPFLVTLNSMDNAN